MVTGETADEFQIVFFPNRKVGVSLAAANDMINKRWLDPFGDVHRTLIIVGKHVVLTPKTGPGLLEPGSQQRANRAADVKFEVSNRCQVAESRRRGNPEVFQQFGHLYIDGLARPTGEQK